MKNKFCQVASLIGMALLPSGAMAQDAEQPPVLTKDVKEAIYQCGGGLIEKITSTDTSRKEETYAGMFQIASAPSDIMAFYDIYLGCVSDNVNLDEFNDLQKIAICGAGYVSELKIEDGASASGSAYITKRSKDAYSAYTACFGQ